MLYPLEIESAPRIKGDLVLVPGQEWASRVANLVDQPTSIIPVRRTLRRTAWEKVMALPSRTRAMLVNNDREAAFETIALLYELGARHIDLVPVYPGSAVPDLDLALTPNEPDYVPPSVTQVLNIGDRVVDASTLLDIASRFSIPDTELSHSIAEHLRDTVPCSPGLATVLGNLADTRKELELVLDMVHEGVIAFDDCGRIRLLNREAEKTLNKKAWQYVGRSVSDILPVKPFHPQQPFTESVCNIDGKSFVLSKAWGKGIGVLTLRKTQDIEELDALVRREMKKTGYVARYTFKDIIGRSAAITRAVNLAKNIALRDSPILIYGESGTGKELFAQAIHNASRRAPYPFVAINCAAMPDTLLESELFGYEEGAFTGAKKGGKPGLFEQAHRGTLFLDEIADIPLRLQARLLRVLQEKEVLRLGGTRLVPVDVRIISASNKDLRALVEKGAFREDLYYRVSVLPLTLPTLAERIEDLPLIVAQLMKEKGDEREIPNEVLEAMKRYSWPGNVRELENCVEYMLSMSQGEITLSSLPDYVTSGEKRVLHGGVSKQGLQVLRLAYQLAQEGKSVGRRSIAALAGAGGLRLGESQIRSQVRLLAQKGYVTVKRGRSGIILTDEGINLARKLADPPTSSYRESSFEMTD
ncbi:MAG TPA: sigma 54-interacting transcriptional regulator [Firmicutes bacterium]|nr:sigma 54-interacting transcriptional regulator [Bacillota bacterium]